MDLPFCLSLKLDLLRLQAALISDDPRAAKGPPNQSVSIRRQPPPELASRVDSALTHLDMAVAAFYAEDGGRDEKGDDDEIVRWEKDVTGGAAKSIHPTTRKEKYIIKKTAGF